MDTLRSDAESPTKVTVGPPHTTIHSGCMVYFTDADGQVSSPNQRGLFWRDTRLISHWRILANGKSWDLLNGGAVVHFASRASLLNQSITTETGDIAARALELVICRILDGGMNEILQITNYGVARARLDLEIQIQSDFADLFEVRSGQIERRGKVETDWDAARSRLMISYSNRDFARQMKISSESRGSDIHYANGRIVFKVDVEPGDRWRSHLLYAFGCGRDASKPPTRDFSDLDSSAPGQSLALWRRRTAKITTSNDELSKVLGQAAEDISSLRFPVGESEDTLLFAAAGAPWYVAVFGRDSLIVSLQGMTLNARFACDVLQVLGNLQANERDDFRDAEPGKIPHELRCGELAHFGLIPQTPYYGSADATPLYLIVLHTAWKWTGDRTLISRHLATAERCLQWIDHFGDRDGDGFQEYETRSSQGYVNQGWKDSGKAIVDLNGAPVQGPKALCELQGYVYDAWLRMAEVYDELERQDRAQELREKAAILFRRFNEAFWDEKLGYYALTLDGDKRRVMSIASNPGHCLWSGIVPHNRAARVVQRLMQPDMWSGWGIRTLSADHPAFNPHSYQRGAVWPHDNGIIALGMRRYGFAQEAARVAHDTFLAASYFAMFKTPELYAGTCREPHDFPVQHMGANVPQAWAAGTAFMLLQAMLGLDADAPHGKLNVDPALPPWLSRVVVKNLRIGDRVLDIGFQRDGAASDFEILGGNDVTAVVRASFAKGQDL